MKVAVFSAKAYDRQFLQAANTSYNHEIVFFEPRLTQETSAPAADFPVVCAFVNDQLDAAVLQVLAQHGTRLIALRSAGFNHVDLTAVGDLGLTVVRVPASTEQTSCGTGDITRNAQGMCSRNEATVWMTCPTQRSRWFKS